MKLEFSRKIFEKLSNIKFYENPSSGTGLIHEAGQTDMTTLIAAFRNFAKAPKKLKYFSVRRPPISKTALLFWKVLRLSRGAAPNDKSNLNYI